MKKTVKINVSDKELDLLACGYCFAIVDEEHEYCWRCGRYFDVEFDPAGNFDDLMSFIKKEDEEK